MGKKTKWGTFDGDNKYNDGNGFLSVGETHEDFDDDDGFDGYEALSTNPGWTLLLSTALYCVGLACIVLCLVSFKTRSNLFQKGKDLMHKVRGFFGKAKNAKTKQWGAVIGAQDLHHNAGAGENESEEGNGTGQPDGHFTSMETPYEKRDDDAALRVSTTSHDNTVREAPDGGMLDIYLHRRGLRGSFQKYLGNGHRLSFSLAEFFDNEVPEDSLGPLPPQSGLEKSMKVAPAPRTASISSLASKESGRSVSLLKETEADDERLNLRRLLKLDGNTKDMHKLAAPWIFSSLVSHVHSVVIVVLISHYIGNDDTVAYVTVEFYLSMFQVAVYSIYDSCYKHANVAISADDCYLAGQYVQISMFFSFVLSIPAVVFATLWMGDLLHWLGFCDYIAAKGHDYAILSSMLAMWDSVNNVWFSLLDLTDHANFSAGIGFLESASGLAFTFAAVIRFDFSLFQLGALYLVHGVIWALIDIGIIMKTKWLAPYYKGMFGNFSLENTSATKAIFKTSIPLILVALSIDLEWRLLSFFASYQGPAEAAAWILLEYLWEFLETGTTNFASAAATQVTSLLAGGEAETARLVTYQSLLLGAFYGGLGSLVMLFAGDSLIGLLTTDFTLASMMQEMLPYLIVSNPFIATGTLASSLNEALGKYYIGLWTYWISSCFVTIPAAAIMTFVFGFNGESIAAAAAMGYTTSGMMQANILVESNYERAVERTKAGLKSECEDSSEDGGDDDNTFDADQYLEGIKAVV